MATLEELYNHSAKLSNAKDKISEHSSDFEAVIKGFKGSSNEKRLASQICATHLHHFPQLVDRVLDSLFDLCEDGDDLMVRKQAIKDLALICKRNTSHVGRVADILVQLLQSNDSLEQTLLWISLTSLLRLDTKATLGAVFNRVMSGSDILRERALSFLQSRVKTMSSEDLLAKEGVEELLVTNCKKVLEDVTGSEFKSVMKLLMSLPSLQSLQGRQQLLDLIVHQANLIPDADVNDADNLNCLLECLEQAGHLFSKNVKSDRFVEHLCLRVLPNMASKHQNGDLQLSVFKILADICAYAGSLKDVETCVLNIYTILIEYMPAPPEETVPSEEFPPLEFSHVECLMTALHLLAKQCQPFLKQPERLKEFRARLQYFARGVQAYNKSLRQLQDKTTEEKSVKELALKVTSNISILIKDLFHNPPHYHSTIHLSFKTNKATTPALSPPGSKRPATGKTNAADVVKKLRSDQPRYVPPSGKFSSSLNTGAKKV